MNLYFEGLAPSISGNEVANLYQEFARGYFSMYISGPWQLGEFRNRLPAELQDDWGTAPLPGPTGPASGVSLAEQVESLVLYRASKHKAEAWRKLMSSSRGPTCSSSSGGSRVTCPGASRRGATPRWRDPDVRAFGEQLTRVVATPKVPE